MTDSDLKSILIFLSKHGKYDTVTQRTDPDKFIIPDRSDLFRELKRGGDGSQLNINFADKSVRLFTWSESHHNGDHYGESSKIISWGELSKYDSQLERAFMEVLKQKAWERVVNDHAKVLRDQVLEAGGSLNESK